MIALFMQLHSGFGFRIYSWGELSLKCSASWLKQRRHWSISKILEEDFESVYELDGEHSLKTDPSPFNSNN